MMLSYATSSSLHAAACHAAQIPTLAFQFFCETHSTGTEIEGERPTKFHV